MRQELRHVRRISLRSDAGPAVMPRRPFAEELREPRLVLDFFMKNRERQIVGAMILAGGQAADLAVAGDRAALGGDEHFQHRIDAGWICRKSCRWTRRQIMESFHVGG